MFTIKAVQRFTGTCVWELKLKEQQLQIAGKIKQLLYLLYDRETKCLHLKIGRACQNFCDALNRIQLYLVIL